MHDDVNLWTIMTSYSSETKIGQEFFGQRDDQILLEYRVASASLLERQMRELHDLFVNHASEMARIVRIKAALLGGDIAWPLVIFKDKKDFEFPTCQIREGNHRAVAHYLLGSPKIPVFIMRYSFDPL